VISYTDTRGLTSRPRTFTEVVLDGIAPGGGLYVPERLPRLETGDLKILAGVPYHERAASVFAAFEPDVPATRIAALTATAYGENFAHASVAPVRRVADDRYVLELWHGPTLAFKDMALQCMPLFFSEAIVHQRDQGLSAHDFLVLVATSGDTGVAALNGFADREHTRICVYYPADGVSAIQQAQMVTQPGDNLTVVAVEGDFDACQSSVKAVFDDEAFTGDLAGRHDLVLSSANSINWGRLLPQIVYYVSAYADMAGGGLIAPGDELDFCVPTGNFGNILSAWYAREMGVPIGRLYCASNTNNVLSDFLAGGVYDISARSLVKTPSPSMDILISSNLERLLYHVAGGDEEGPSRHVAATATVREWMASLRSQGRFAVDDGTFARIKERFTGAWVDNATCLRTIGEVQREHGYLLDPHTAVAWKVAGELAADRPVVIVSTAHWSKFPSDVVRGLTGLAPDDDVPGGDDELALLDRVTELAPGAQLPPQLTAVRSREVRFRQQIGAGRESLERQLGDWLEATS
jgi:threonine synthase